MPLDRMKQDFFMRQRLPDIIRTTTPSQVGKSDTNMDCIHKNTYCTALVVAYHCIAVFAMEIAVDSDSHAPKTAKKTIADAVRFSNQIHGMVLAL